MAEKTKTRKNRKIILRFLRLFPQYRELEETIHKKDEAQELSAAIIMANKSDIVNLQKKIVSDSNLIISMNRYTEALEGKAAMQADMLKELRERLDTLLAIPKNKDKPAKQKKRPQ